MKSKRIFLIIILLFALLLGGAYILYDRLGSEMTPNQLATQPTPSPESSDVPAAPTETPAPERPKAPDFTVYDREGNAVHLSDFVGKPVVLNFWTSWCGPCKMEMPEFNTKYLELGNDIHFLMVNATGGRETMTSATAFLDSTEYTFPVYFDTDVSATMAYNATGLPTTYFIDAEGYAVAWAQGVINAEVLQQGIDMILPDS